MTWANYGVSPVPPELIFTFAHSFGKPSGKTRNFLRFAIFLLPFQALFHGKHACSLTTA